MTDTPTPAELRAELEHLPTTHRPVGDVVHLDRFGNQPFKA